MRKEYSIVRTLVIMLLIAPVCTGAHAQVLWGMTSNGGSKLGGGNIFSLHTDGTGFTERYAFFADGAMPDGQRLLAYGDGYLYGVIPASYAGTGLLYKMLPDGTGYQAVYYFPAGLPSSSIIKGADGYLYGTLQNTGGGNNYGNIYKISNTGTGFQVLHNFNYTDGAFPNTELLMAGNTIYGSTANGGTYQKGVLFSVHTDGTSYTVMHHFTGTDGAAPNGPLTLQATRSGDMLYGTTSSGGNSNMGVLFQINATGNVYQSLMSFTPTMGYGSGPVVKFVNSILYIATQNTGTNGGMLIAYNMTTPSWTTVHVFSYDAAGSLTQSPTGLIGINNVLYGTARLGGAAHQGVVFKVNIDASGYQELHAQTDPSGYMPNLSYINGQLYGLTHGGAVTGVPGLSNGTLYRLNTDGTGFQQLHSFNSSNGYGPSGSIIHASDGNLYGLTTYGGSGYSDGVAFNIKTDGTGYNPFQLVDNGPAAGQPQGSLIQASNGHFYGMNRTSGPSFNGSVFSLTATPPSFQQYYPFCFGNGCADYPAASLLQASDGWLYGMTPNTSQSGTQGAIFKMNTDGTGYALLHTFTGADGALPTGSLIQAPDGFLYGLTQNGGTGDYGTIFRIKTDGSFFQTLFQFGTGGSGVNGIHPAGSLLRGADGKLYGTTFRGGAAVGTVFRVNTDGTSYQVLVNFTGANGSFPLGSLAQDPATNVLYGMANQGGNNNFGTVFKLNPDGSGFAKLFDFTGANGKLPKGDLLILPAGSPLRTINQSISPDIKPPIAGGVSIATPPNPVQNSFSIHFSNLPEGKLAWLLSDLNGKTVRENRSVVAKSGSFSQTVNMAGLPAGMYVLKTLVGQQSFISKIIKQ